MRTIAFDLNFENDVSLVSLFFSRSDYSVLPSGSDLVSDNETSEGTCIGRNVFTTCFQHLLQFLSIVPSLC